MHDDEIDIDGMLVRRLLAAQFPQWADLPLKPVRPLGTDNALYRLGDGMVVRLPRTERTAGTLEKERLWLPRLAPFLPLPVPFPLADGTPTEDYPLSWSVYRWLEGETAAPERITDAGLFAHDLAGFVGELQAIDAAGGPAPGEHNFFRGAPVSVLDTATRGAIDALHGEIDVKRATAVWEEALAAPRWDRPPVWVHGDLDSRNLLVRDGRLAAVIDFGGLGVGDPACDVMSVWKVVAPVDRDIFRRDLGVDDATWARARGWIVFQSCSALSYYTMENNRALVVEARRWLSAVLGSPE
jgi:aminoglycoside phosphotransferase (APT) family kinase protein